jgi:hypothetical protein
VVKIAPGNPRCRHCGSIWQKRLWPVADATRIPLLTAPGSVNSPAQETRVPAYVIVDINVTDPVRYEE